MRHFAVPAGVVGIVPDSAVDARRDGAGHAGFSGNAPRPHVATHPGRCPNTMPRSTAGHDHSASRSAPGVDSAHTQTTGHRPSLAPRRTGAGRSANTQRYWARNRAPVRIWAQLRTLTVTSYGPGLRQPLRRPRSNPNPGVPSPGASQFTNARRDRFTDVVRHPKGALGILQAGIPFRYGKSLR